MDFSGAELAAAGVVVVQGAALGEMVEECSALVALPLLSTYKPVALKAGDRENPIGSKAL